MFVGEEMNVELEPVMALLVFKYGDRGLGVLKAGVKKPSSGTSLKLRDAVMDSRSLSPSWKVSLTEGETLGMLLCGKRFDHSVVVAVGPCRGRNTQRFFSLPHLTKHKYRLL
jgi:hypothetical protein